MRGPALLSTVLRGLRSRLLLSIGSVVLTALAVGSAVLGGTITGTVLGVIFVPLFFVVVMRIFGRKQIRENAEKAKAETA